MWKFAIILLVAVIYGVNSQTPYICSFTDSNDNFYDLTPLSNPTTDYVISYDPLNNNNKMWTNICRPTFQTLCGTGSSTCQLWDPNNRNGHASLGLASTITFSYGTQHSGAEGLIASFTGGNPANDSPRSMQIDFICDSSAGVGSPLYKLEINLRFYFQWNTTYACPTTNCNATSCGACTQDDCVWCLNSNSCTSKKTDCPSYITNGKYCPVSKCAKLADCSSCTEGNTYSDYPCEWCLDSANCIDQGVDCGNVIAQPQFCNLPKF